MPMFLSNFNLSKTIGNETFVYNTFTHGFIKIHTDEWISLSNTITQLQFNKDHPLVKTGIIVSEKKSHLLLYKYMYLIEMFNDFGLFIYIAPTMDCNMNCVYCFEGEHKHSGIVTDNIIENIVSFIDISSKKKVNIVWFGGEPLLAFQKMLRICERLKEKEIQFESSLITNGTLLTERIVNKLHKLNLQFIQISMDGTEQIQNRRRCFKGGAPSFDIIIQNIRYLLDNSNIPINIQVTVDKKNPTAQEELKKFIKDKFSNHYETQRIQIGKNYIQNRTGFDSEGSCFSQKDIIKDMIQQLYINNSHKRTGIPQLSKPCMFRRRGCYAIDEQGDVYKCLEHLGAPQYKIGSLHSGTFNSTAIATYALGNDPFNDPKCLSCNILPICGGGCPIDRIKYAEGDINSYCSYLKNTIEDLLPHLYKVRYTKKTSHDK